VLDEAVRDELIGRNPARDRADRRYRSTAAESRHVSLPSLKAVLRVTEACGEVHQSYPDRVMLCASLAVRGAEVGGLNVGDVDWGSGTVLIERQSYRVGYRSCSCSSRRFAG